MPPKPDTIENHDFPSCKLCADLCTVVSLLAESSQINCVAAAFWAVPNSAVASDLHVSVVGPNDRALNAAVC